MEHITHYITGYKLLIIKLLRLAVQLIGFCFITVDISQDKHNLSTKYLLPITARISVHSNKGFSIFNFSCLSVSMLLSVVISDCRSDFGQCICVCTHYHMCMYTLPYVYVHITICVCTHYHMCMYTLPYVYVHITICVCTHYHMCMYTLPYVYVHITIRVCTH